MGSTPKRKKSSSEMNEMQSEDRISALPDSIASHILSFLPTKDAVATSVLSTRWNETWTHITTLDFCDYELLHNPYSWRSKPSVQTKFVNFVYRVLMLCAAPCLDKFRLLCTERYDASHVNAWIASGLRREVKQIELVVVTKNQFTLPNKLFTCTALVDLKLCVRCHLNIPSSVCFPCLTRLSLQQVKLSDDNSITRLLSGCPVLEKLTMFQCMGENVEVFKISTPSLKYLDLDYFPYEEQTMSLNFRIVLDTPNLVHLRVTDYTDQSYELHALPKLSAADIEFRRPFDELQLNDIYGETLNKLLEGISTAHSLKLSMEGYLFDICKIPSFRNLKELELNAYCDSTYKQLRKLLECSPLLEAFTFNEGIRHKADSLREMLEWKPPIKVPNCLLHHLKTIKYENFQGMEEQMILVGYFLKTAEVLEKLIIHPYELVDEPLDVSKKLLMLPRASRICQIKLL